MYVTFNSLIQFSLFVVALISLVYMITRKNK